MRYAGFLALVDGVLCLDLQPHPHYLGIDSRERLKSNMAIGYAEKGSLAFHIGHDLEVADYFDGQLVSIECITCGCVLIDESEENNDSFD